MPNQHESSATRTPWLDLSETQPALGVIRVTGPDSGKFLQGQLSADIAKLQSSAYTLAGLHNREGRVIALLRILTVAPGDFLAVLPRDLVPDTIERLRKFVFRAKTTLQDASDALRVCGGPRAQGAPVSAVASCPWGESRQIWIVPNTNNSTDSFAADADSRAAWLAADVADGLPQVYRATSEAFVSQMLNLDALGAIAFDKGCYTGQEVIARAHYRGRVKRRLQRLRYAGPHTLHVGDEGKLESGGTYRIVEVGAPSAAGVEFLAVTTLETAPEAGDTPTKETVALRAERLPLPYALPT